MTTTTTTNNDNRQTNMKNLRALHHRPQGAITVESMRSRVASTCDKKDSTELSWSFQDEVEILIGKIEVQNSVISRWTGVKLIRDRTDYLSWER